MTRPASSRAWPMSMCWSRWVSRPSWPRLHRGCGWCRCRAPASIASIAARSRPGTHLANAYGHEAGIAEYIIGAMIALTRSFGRLDASLREGEWESQWAVGTAAAAAVAGAGGQDTGHPGLRPHRARRWPAAPPPSTCRSAPSGDRRRRTCRQACRSSAAPSASTTCCARPTTSPSRCRSRPTTRNLIDERRLQLMKPSAFLINVARAEIIDEAALYRGAGGRQARRRGARCLVPLSDVARADPAGHAALPRARQCDHDSARLGLDRRHARGAGQADRGQHRADGAGRAPLNASSIVLNAASEGIHRWSAAPAVLLRLADHRRRLRHHGDRRQARTAFSLLLPPLIDEFGWDRGVVAGAFSFGFLVSAVLEPDRRPRDGPQGPARRDRERRVPADGRTPARAAHRDPWQLYATLGVMVGARRQPHDLHRAFAVPAATGSCAAAALAISIAFSGVGVGAIVLLPWLQTIIERDGWRAACWAMGLLVLLVLGPLNLLVPAPAAGHRPAARWGIAAPAAGKPRARVEHRRPRLGVVDWTLARALRTARFWWIVLGFFCALFAWYAVQVHQTKYLIEVGFTPLVAAWALGHRERRCHPRADRPRRPVRPHRPGMGLVGGLRRLRRLLRRADRARGRAVAASALR